MRRVRSSGLARAHTFQSHPPLVRPSIAGSEQVRSLEAGVLPSGIRRGLNFHFKKKPLLLGVAIYAVISIVMQLALQTTALRAHFHSVQLGVGALCAAGLVVLALRTRPAGSVVRAVRGPVTIGETRIGTESTTVVQVGDASGAMPYRAAAALPRGAGVLVYVDSTSNEIVAVLPV